MGPSLLGRFSCVYSASGSVKCGGFCAYRLKYDLNHQTAAGADCCVFAIPEVLQRNLESVAAWTWIVIDLHGRVEGHVFNLNLVVKGHFERLPACLEMNEDGAWGKVGEVG